LEQQHAEAEEAAAASQRESEVSSAARCACHHAYCS
jgi:hypothetical protein